MSGTRPTSVHGLRAVEAALARRPEAVVRLLHARDARGELAELLTRARAQGIECQAADGPQLTREARSPRHGGLVALVAPPPILSREELLQRLPRDAVLVALDGVENPHNAGAILRSLAWFGATALVLPGPRERAQLPPAALRVAQGAGEVVPLAAVGDLPQALRRLSEAGVTVIAAEPRGGEPPLDAAYPRPVCLVLGSEEEGLSPAVRAACARRITIPGTGQVESLNVSVSAAVLLAAATREGPGAPLRPARRGR